MKFDFSQYKDPTGNLTPPSDEDLGFLGHAGDIAMAPVRGIAGAAEAVYDLADWALMDWLPDAEDNFGLGHSKTLAGGLVQGISQFMVGFVPGLGAASWAGRGLGLAGVGLKAGKIGKAVHAAKAAGQAKKATAIQWGASFGRSVAAGAVADFAVFDAQEARLSNLLQQFPALQNPVSEFLAADEDDTEVEGRLKNLLEGGILGGMMEPFVMGLRALRTARKARQGGMTPDEAAEVAMEKSGLRDKGIAQDISPSSKELDNLFGVPAAPKKIPPYSDDYPVPKGIDEMKNRINREASQGDMSAKEAQFANNLIDRLNQQGGLEDLGIRFRTNKNIGGEGVAGNYDFYKRIVSIATQTVERGGFKKTFTHEIWHALSEIVAPKHLSSLRRDLKKAQKAFSKKHGLKHEDMFDEFGEASGAFRKFVKDNGIEKQESYRLTNEEEWLAENMMETTLKRLDLEADTKSLIGFMRYTIQNILTEIKATFGKGTYDKVARGFLEGTYSQGSKMKPGALFDPAGLARPFRGIVADISEEASTGASTTTKDVPINFDRVSSVDATRAVIDNMRAGTHDRLHTRQTMSDAELAADANPHTAEIADMLGWEDPGDLVAMLQSHGERGRDYILLHNAIRDHSDRLSNEAVKSIEADIRIGNEAELMHAEQLIRLSEEFIIATSEGATVAGQLLRGQKRIAGIETMPTPKAPEAPPISGRGGGEGTGTGTGRGVEEGTGTGTGRGAGEGTEEGAARTGLDRILSEESYRPDTPEAAQVRSDYFEAVGGGDRTRGVKIIKERVTRWKAVKDAQGNIAATKAARDFATKPQMLVEYWLNAILSGPLTHLVNATSNTANTLFLPFERALGQAATLHFGEAAKELSFFFHLGSQFQDAMTSAGSAWKNWGDPLDSLTAFDTAKGGGFDRAISARNFGKSTDDVGGAAIDYIGKALNLPSRLLLTSDSFFKHLNYRATVRAGLFREGAAAGMTGRQLADHVEEGLQSMIKDGQHYSYKNVRMAAEKEARAKFGGMKNGAEKTQAIKSHILKYMNDNWDKHVDDLTGVNSRSLLAKKALHYGREVTYTQSLTDPNRSALVKAAGKWNTLVNEAPVFRLVTPFVRTPTNLISFFLNRSVGAYADLAKIGVRKVRHLKAADKELAEAMGKKGPELQDVLGRMATGGMFFYGASMAYSSGALTGGGPRDPHKRRLMESQGWQPYSFRIGDTWVSYRRFDPFASFFGAAADIAESMAEAPPEERGTLEALMGAVVTSAAKNITNKSYLTGMARVSSMLSDPDRYAASWLEQTAASMTPFSSLAGQTIGSSEHQKELRGALDAIRAKYGLTGDSVIDFDAKVEDRRNVFGAKIARPDVLWPAPAFYTKVKDDFVLGELNNLGHGFSPPSRIVNEIDTSQHLNSTGQSFHDRWQEQHGTVRIGGRTLKQAMKALMKSRGYQRLPADHFEGNKSPRIGEVQKLIRKYRARAFDLTLREFPDVNALYKRNSQIKSYRKAGRDIQSLLDY